VPTRRASYRYPVVIAQHEAFATRVDQALQAFVCTQRRKLSELGSDLDPLMDAAAQAVSGGKRLRPAFCYWAWRAAGRAADDHIVVAASSLELLHASAIVHDDVIDDSDTRRGQPAAHRYFQRLGLPGSDRQFGFGSAILLGDLLLSWSDQQLRASGLPIAAVARAMPYFDAMRTEVAAGQFLDLLAQASDQNSVERAMRVLRFKSAKYTVERPLHVGAALAGADESLITSLSAYGIPLGEAFQLRDDVLGVFGDPGVTGKPAGDDLRQGKRTVLMSRAVEMAGHEDRALLESAVGNRRLTDDSVARTLVAVERSGALGYVEKLITQLSATALAAVTQAPIRDEEARTALCELAEAATRREA
jgi:geranylgeranyl diphosphate synthase, type I